MPNLIQCRLFSSTIRNIRSGFYMSELLYLYGELDRRVRPLMFTIRRWAKDQGLIQDRRPTSFFTNFSLTLMVLFFLQKKYQMLPPLRELQRLASKLYDFYGRGLSLGKGRFNLKYPPHSIGGNDRDFYSAMSHFLNECLKIVSALNIEKFFWC